MAWDKERLMYIVLLDTLIDTYHTKVALSRLHDPLKMIPIIRSLKVFINDMVLHASAKPNTTFEELLQSAQHNM